MSEKTHFRKNLDPRYISGEDLQYERNGLKKEMVVILDRFEDSDVYDQNAKPDPKDKNKKTYRTGLYLKDLNGNAIYKPTILNVTNGKVLADIFKSPYMEDWFNLPFIIYAAPDSRFGFVVRYKKYIAPPKTTDKRALEILESSNTLSELTANWSGLSLEEKNFATVIALKEKLKIDLKGNE